MASKEETKEDANNTGIPWFAWETVFKYIVEYQIRDILLLSKQIKKNYQWFKIPKYIEVNDVKQGIEIFKKFREKHPNENFVIRLGAYDLHYIKRLKYDGLIIETNEMYIKYGSKGPVSVIFKEGVTTIGRYAFGGCNGLTSLTFPESLKTIGEYAFYECTGLTSLAFPESLKTIEACAFKDCTGLTSVTFPEGLTTISRWLAFSYRSGLTSLILPEGLTRIGWDAFYNCSGLTSLILPEGKTSIRESTFRRCFGLTSVYSGGAIRIHAL